ncbi:MAG: HAD-IC family P-type ATPase [Candidatus Izemoplasmatales bacterium]|nr:HAD-IC family P-type ATPase [Candidatus Izemoplasmatales bacterium]
MARKKKTIEEYQAFGLTALEVNERIIEQKTNKTVKSNLKTPWKIIRDNLFSYFNLILTIIALLLISIGSYENTWFIVIALANTLIGIIQEFKARSIIKNLSLITDSKVTIVREAIEIDINVEDVVIDDIFYLDQGKQVITDSVVEDGVLSVNEANLTGESHSITKEKGDRLLSGSYVINGEAYVRAIAVGKDNYIESLQSKVKTLSKPKSVILNSLRKLLKLIGIIIIPLGLMTFYNAFKMSSYDYLPDFLQDSEAYKNALIKMAGSMVAMVPSGLFLLTSMTFATSVIKLAKHKTLVQELYSIETLARVDTLCLDKTGTITDGTMKVNSFVKIKKSLLDGDDFDDATIKKIVSSMNHHLKDKNQTADALKSYFGDSNYYDMVSMVRFDSQNKYSLVEFKQGIFALGAPEMIYKKYSKIKNQVEQYAQEGMRVLLLAKVPKIKDEKISGEAKPISLIIIEDNIRDSAIATIQKFNASSVNVKVISGDNALTVSEIARKASVIDAEKYISLDDVADEELEQIALNYNVFGRVKPHQKKLLIEHLQNHSRKVCMIGDGVNDVLALKQADVSVSLASGTDASRNISHFVLLTDDFAALPKVVKEGRQIVSNLEKASVLYLVKTLYTILLTFILLFTTRIYPFAPKQMFVIETFIIGVPSFFIALEPNNRMFSGVFIKNVLKNVLPGALIIIANLLAVFWVSSAFNILTEREISSVGIIAATFAYWLILVNVASPLNILKTILILVSALLSILAFTLPGLRTLFEIEQFTVPSFLLLLLLMETSYILFSIYKRELIRFWPNDKVYSKK